MADKNIKLFHSNHSAKRMRQTARKLGMVDYEKQDQTDNRRGLPGSDQEESDTM